MIIAEHLGASCSWIEARQNGKIVGLLPFLKKDGPLGTVFNSLAYYGSNGGVIQVKQDAESKLLLIDAFYTLAAEAKASSATIISNPLERDSDFYNENIVYDFRDERIGLITHLPLSEDSLITRFENPRPRNIRRAIKEGVTVKRGSVEALPFLYETHAENMKAIGGLAKTCSFFDAIQAGCTMTTGLFLLQLSMESQSLRFYYFILIRQSIFYSRNCGELSKYSGFSIGDLPGNV